MSQKSSVKRKKKSRPLAETKIEAQFGKGFWPRFKQFIKNKETPYLVLNLNIIRKNYNRLTRLMPYAKIYYAVKSNPSLEIISLLADLGSSFDVASVQELDRVLEVGVSAERISYGNTIKKKKDISYAFRSGIRMFACDSEEELKKIARHAPGAKVFFRLLTEGSGADWPLSKKFGCHPSMIFDLVLKAKDMDVVPYGISFHVGSQQRDIGQWDNAISQCRYLFDALQEEKVNLKMINLGGGLPAQYRTPTQSLTKYATEINRFLKEDFGEDLPEIIIEPGRSLVADAGIIVTEVVLISQKSSSDLFKWVYLDVGKFNGLIEILEESIKYPIVSDRKGEPGEVILAGPTCDSMDILYENFKYSLPTDLQIGDKLYVLSAGAYTRSYSSLEFNGFPPLKMYIIR